MDWRLELVQVPVSDVDRAKAFYTEQAGFNADHDHQVNDEIRFVQLTPPGRPARSRSAPGSATMKPGSVQGLQLVVSDIEAARAELLARGVEVSEVQDFPWGSFLFFSDPDGNGWAVQQIPRTRALLDEALDERERGVGDFAPAAVDRQRVAAARDLDDLGDARVALLLLERRHWRSPTARCGPSRRR